MLLSIIVVNWNVLEVLHGCLQSVQDKCALPRGYYEVIVVDNGSHDGSVAMIRHDFPDVRVLANAANLGFGVANNRGFEVSRGRYVLLLNPDTVVAGGAVERLIRFMEDNPRVAAAGARLLNADGSLQRWTAGAFPSVGNVACHYLFLDRLLPQSLRPPALFLEVDITQDRDVDWVSGACMILRREALGPAIFDPRFFLYGEDMELCHRLKRAGWRVAYVPAASVVHLQGASINQQQGEILLSSLKGPRLFLRMTRGRAEVALIDALTLAGFALRWALFGLASKVWPDAALGAKARSSRHLFHVAWRVMRSP